MGVSDIGGTGPYDKGILQFGRLKKESPSFVNPHIPSGGT